MYKKSDKEILAIITMIQEEIDSLPEENIFGDSNAEDIEESTGWVMCLQCALVGADFTNHDVKKWLQGDHSPISDFE